MSSKGQTGSPIQLADSIDISRSPIDPFDTMSKPDPLDPSPQDAIPGTVHLVDLEGTLLAKHSSEKGAHDIVLMPAPSNDPDDPLNWSPSRKGLATACMCV